MAPKKEPAAGKIYLPGDIVLAKVKGFPMWPGQVVDNEDAPVGVKKEKPPKGKPAALVQFFPTGDYSWTGSKDMSSLSPREIDAYLSAPHRKSGDLLGAYRVAQNPAAWNAARARETAEYDEAVAFLEEDQLASEGEFAQAEMEGKSEGKKRKRKSEGAEGKAKDKSEQKAKKAKLEKLAKTRTAGGSSKKAAAGAEHSEDEAEPSAKKSKSAADDTEDAGLKVVREWRHKLQKIFLGKGTLAAADMPKCAQYFDDMERFEMHKDWLAESKLGKVLKRIHLLADGQIPDEDKFRFRERAAALATTWTNGINTDSPAPAAAPATNGQAPPAAAPVDVPMAEAAPAPAPAPEPVPVVEAPAAVEAAVEVPAVATNGAVAMEVDAAPKENGAAVVEDKVDEPKAEEVVAPAPLAA